MNFGTKIRDLRLQKTITQEQLAAHLNVSPQAVSKWENNLTLPDIQLLPEISVFFGVTIDELFDLTDEKHLRRIENMLDTKRTIDRNDFEYAQNFLLNGLSREEKKPRCLTLLADLYNAKATEYASLAEYYAKEALTLEPENKDNHTALCKAQHGTYSDWYLFSHTDRIRFYQDFVQKNPGYARGYLWLLDELLADNRCGEAKTVLDRLSRLDSSCRVPLYQGQILWAQGDREGALQIWHEMAEKFGEDWLAQLSMADCLTHICRYEEAVSYYQKALQLQPKPRYTDAWLSMAQIYEIQEKYEDAIHSWEQVEKICREEWHYTEGEALDRPAREIARLKERMANQADA